MLTLWLLIVLSIMLSGNQLLMRNTAQQGRWIQDEIQAELAAEAGIATVVMDQNRPLQSRRWEGRGDRQQHSFEMTRVGVSVQSVKGLLDANSATPDIIKKVVNACNGNPNVVNEWLDVRQVHPFLVTTQLRELPQMNETLFSCLLPHLTVWSGMSQPDGDFATPFLKRILHFPSVRERRADPGNVLAIESVAKLRNGRVKKIRVTLLLMKNVPGKRPYRILDWQD